MNDTQYNNLEKHFKLSKSGKIGKFSFPVIRLPRTFKKKYKKEFESRKCFLKKENVLWYIILKLNPNFNNFLIKKICESNKN